MTASREDPVQPASSSWVMAKLDVHPVALGLAEAVRQLHEPRAQAADRVSRQVLDALAVRVAQPAGDHPGQHEGHTGRALEEAAERLPRDRDDLDRLEGRGGGGARAPVERRHLADEVTGLADAEQRFAAALGDAAELNPPRGQDEHGLAGLALVEQRRARSEAPRAAERPQRIDVPLVEHVQEARI